MQLVERDREADGGVFASAVALRVFLFLIPFLLVLVASVGFLSSRVTGSQASRQVGVTGELAAQIRSALEQSSRTRWLALMSGIVGVFLAGRALARVLTAASRRAWQLSSRVGSASPTRVAGALAGMLAGAGALAIIVNRVRQAMGIVGGSAALLTAAIVYSVAWCVVSLTLPRGRSDRTAVLPGALFVGISLAAGQSVLQFVVPGKVARASQLYGAIGVVLVALSWFFLVGRVFVTSFAIDAVVWEQFGSLTTWLLRWKRVHSVVARHPRFEAFLLAGSTDDETQGQVGDVRLLPNGGDAGDNAIRERAEPP